MMAQNTAVGIRAASGEIHAFGRSRNAAFTLQRSSRVGGTGKLSQLWGSVRRRPKVGQASCLSGAGKTPALPSDETASTVTIERIPGPAIPEFGAEWDAAWEKNLLAQALERVRERIEGRQFQVFDLNVMKAWPAKDVAQTLGISVARIYLTKQRVAALLKKEGDW